MGKEVHMLVSIQIIALYFFVVSSSMRSFLLVAKGIEQPGWKMDSTRK
jgi:hypothetical protein